MTPISGCRQYIFSVVKVDAILLYEPINYQMTVLHPRLESLRAHTLSETEIPSDCPVKLSVSSHTAVL